MERLENLIHGHEPRPDPSPAQRKRMLANSKRRQDRQRARRERVRLRGMNIIDALEDEGRIIIHPRNVNANNE
ncbi:hypothetical protein ES703_105157 [subsurface metagenome]